MKVNTIYWGIVLDDESRVKLLSKFPPKHPNMYAEHMTVAFSPTNEIEDALLPDIGEDILITAISHHRDSKGQAVAVIGPRVDPGMAHVTISCANGVKPVYSNELISKTEPETINPPVQLSGKLGRFTSSGWVFNA